MFRKNIEIKNNKIIITIECELRKLAIEPKRLFTSDVIFGLVPEKYKNKVTLLEQPSLKISNIDKPGHSNLGVWSFKIKTPPKRKTSTTARNSDIIINKE
jgi:hypothetical protein